MEYIFVMSEQKIELETIPGKVLSKVMLNSVASNSRSVGGLRELVDLYEKTILEDVVRQYNNLRDAADILQIHHTTLQRKMQKYHLKFSK